MVQWCSVLKYQTLYSTAALLVVLMISLSHFACTYVALVNKLLLTACRVLGEHSVLGGEPEHRAVGTPACVYGKACRGVSQGLHHCLCMKQPESSAL